MESGTSSNPAQLLTYRVVSDIEGYALLKKKQLGRKMLQYIRIHGSVLSVCANPKSCVTWEVNLFDCGVRLLRKRAFLIQLKTKLSIYVTLASSTPTDAREWVDVLTTSSSRKLENKYTVDAKIGEGAYASVRKAVVTATGDPVAIKTIVKRQFDVTMARELDRELIACCSLNIPGIVNTREIYNTQEKVHIVMELMDGGTLKECVQLAGGTVSEQLAIPIANQVLTTLAYLHRVGATHRDVKLENILCDTKTFPVNRALLCDFGYVNFLEPGSETLRSLVGTPVYVAPEIAERRQYGSGVDVYAVGIMIYRMLFGIYPFDGGDDDEKTMKLIATGQLKFPSPDCDHVSETCKSLIRGLLQRDPRLRLSANGALYHPWFNTPMCSTTPDSAGHIQNKENTSQLDEPAQKDTEHNPDERAEIYPNPRMLQEANSCEARLVRKFSNILSSLNSSVNVQSHNSALGNTATSTPQPRTGKQLLRFALCAIICKNRLERGAGIRIQLKPSNSHVQAHNVHPTKFNPVPLEQCKPAFEPAMSHPPDMALSLKSLTSSGSPSMDSPVTPTHFPDRPDSLEQRQTDRKRAHQVQRVVKRAFSFAAKPAPPGVAGATDRMSPSNRSSQVPDVRTSTRLTSFRNVKRLLSINVANDRS